MRRTDWLLHQLPVAMIEDAFLARFVHIFQDVADSVVEQIDNLPHVFDVTVAPPAMVRTLGGWIGLDWVDPSLPDDLQRETVRAYFSMLRWHGTRRGMQQLLELISGAPAIVEETGGIFTEGNAPEGLGHVVLRVDSSGWATIPDLLRIVRAELPASVTFELYVGDRRVWPVESPDDSDVPELQDAR